MSKLIINTDLGKQKISRHIYGHFAEHLGRCVYEGVWVGEDSLIPNTRGIRNDVVQALRRLNMPNLRWPGGCFADTYHWRHGVGPRQQRASIVNVHWGGVCESNHFGTHEFFDLCEMLSTPAGRCEPYICGNVGSGTVQEMAEWLEYITMPADSPMARLRRLHGRDQPWDVTFWAVGNENWGCGGHMTAQQYAWEYRRYQTYCRHFGGRDRRLYKVACGYDDAWNEVLVRECHRFMDGISIHHYSLPTIHWSAKKGSATNFSVEEWASTLRAAFNVEPLLERTAAILDRYDPIHRIGIVLDEWGTWYDVEPGTEPGFLYQQNTVRDALVAGLTLNILNSWSHRVHMANIAQTINVLQAMVLTDREKMILTPTYHVFEMYKSHQDATLLPSHLECDDYMLAAHTMPQISASASRDARGRMHVSLCNVHHDRPVELTCELRGGPSAPSVAGRILTAAAMNAHNTFENPHTVKPADFTGFKTHGGTLTITLPPRSVVMLDIE